jgi:hypothetical protein
VSSFRGARDEAQYDLAIAEILGVNVGIAEGIRDEHRGLAGQLKALATLVARDEVIKPDHIRCRFREFLSVFLTGTARQFPLFAADLPANGELELAATARAHELELAGLFAFGIKGSLVHI